MVTPDLKVIIEVTLLSSGFSHYKMLTAKLALFFEHLKTQVRYVIINPCKFLFDTFEIISE